MAQLLPNVVQQFRDGNGLPLAGGFLYSYAAGTSTPLATFTDAGGLTQNANPTVLDANGMASVWIGSAAYKFTLKDSSGTLIWTVDNVIWIPAGSIVTASIVDGGVTTAKIALLAITNALLASGSVANGNIQDNSITTSKLVDGSVTQAKAGNFLVPTGAIMPYAAAAAPTGWILCDGSSLLRAGTYAALFAIIGTAYGTADGTHFNVPDLRGMFLRGVTGASGNDPDAAGRTAMNAGGATGNNIGSMQTDQIKSHSHSTSLSDNQAAFNPTGTAPLAGAGVTGSTGGNETRPINAYVVFMIKI